MTNTQGNPGDGELYQHLDATYFQGLIENAQAERERLNQAAALLEPGDMLNHWTEFLAEHLDNLIVAWRADAETALNWR